MKTYEVNFDGLVGLTHHYAGLSPGNLASQKHKLAASNPRAAALQGLQKMKSLADMGLKQAVLPPHPRPHIPTLRKLGFTGNDDKAILEKAWRDAPEIAAKCYSASAMWAANAATVSPFADTCDGRTHFTPANLSSMLHRSIEHETTSKILRTIFSDETRFAHHSALPSGTYFSDEGAANHTRFCNQYEHKGVEFFVYGGSALNKTLKKPQHHPARQTLEASQAIARQHELDLKHCVFAQQHPDAIDAGVFHNDVVAVGNKNLLFYHEKAFLNSEAVITELKNKLPDTELLTTQVPEAIIPLQDAIQSYLFNTQLVSLNDQHTVIIAPSECEENPRIKEYLQQLISDNVFQSVQYFNLRESMQNGGGPACLRLRVILRDSDISSIKTRIFLDDALYDDLHAWIQQHYRDRLHFTDLRDPSLLDESYAALEQLSHILNLEPIYDFQRSL